MGEETSEVLIAAMKDDRKETIYELADLLYHALVLMVDAGIAPDDVRKNWLHVMLSIIRKNRRHRYDSIDSS